MGRITNWCEVGAGWGGGGKKSGNGDCSSVTGLGGQVLGETNGTKVSSVHSAHNPNFTLILILSFQCYPMTRGRGERKGRL